MSKSRNQITAAQMMNLPGLLLLIQMKPRIKDAVLVPINTSSLFKGTN